MGISNCYQNNTAREWFWDKSKYVNPIRGGVKSNLFRAGSQIWPRNPNSLLSIQTWTFYIEITQNLISSNFFFMEVSKKSPLLDYFCTANLLTVYLYLPCIGWTGGGGSDLTTFENRTFRHSKVVKKVIFWHCHENKRCWKLNFEQFWSKKSTFGWKLKIWGVGSDLIAPPPPECFERKNILQKVGEGGVKMTNFDNKKWQILTKNVRNYYSGKVKKFQNSRMRHFLAVYVQKMEVRYDPAPNRVNAIF